MTESRLEQVACDFCGSARSAPVFHRSRSFARHAPFVIVECADCGLRYVSPRLRAEALAELYSESYFRSDDSGRIGYDDYLASRPLLIPTFRDRMALLRRLLGRPGGRLLDVGCASGFGLEAAAEAGFEPLGIELSPFAGAAARARGLAVREGEFLPCAADLPDAHFACVTMWDYLEHVRSPNAEIARAARLLEPGGVFAIATPDVGSIPARLFRARWMGIKPDEHLYYFRRRDLRRALARAGLEVAYEGWAGKHVSLDLFARRLGFYFPILGRAVSAPLRALGLEGRAVYVNPFDILLIVARKPAAPALHSTSKT